MRGRKLIAVSSSPVKAIVSGEHGVVHGTPALTMTFEPANKVLLYEEDGPPSIELKSERGSAVLDEKGNLVGGEGRAHFAPFAAMIKRMVEHNGLHPKKKLVAEIQGANAPKGIGNSASIAAALASTLFHAMQRTPLRHPNPEHDELWSAVQASEEIAHGGKPSGIDAMTVCYGPTKLVRVVEGGKIAWKFESREGVSFPSGTKFLIVDTHMGGERAKTGEMIKLFAEKNNLLKKTGELKGLVELTEEDKKKLRGFVEAFNEIEREMHQLGNAERLGAGLKKNHLLLSRSGVSTKEIDEVVKIAEENGAFGAKLTGAGGKGGAVIVLARSNVAKLRNALLQNNYKIFEARAVPRGTVLEESRAPSEAHVRQAHEHKLRKAA